MIRFFSRGGALAAAALLCASIVIPATRVGADECVLQKDLPDGCLQTGGALGCTAAVQIESPYRLDLSPDDETLYVSTFFGTALVVLDRDTTDGTLSQLAGTAGCISSDGSGGACTIARGFGGPQGVAVSSDLETAYVANPGVSVFDRNVMTGALVQKAGAAGCVTDGTEGCATGNEIMGTTHLALSPGPDNTNLYAVSYTQDALVVFDRDSMTGVLTQKAGAAGCINETGSDGCTDGRGLDGLVHVVASPDGKSVYTIALEGSAIGIFDRDPMTGALTQKAGVAGCLSASGSGGECGVGQHIVYISSAAISADGRHLYVVSGYSGSSIALTVFDRDTMTGALTQKPGPSGCVSYTGSGGLCIDGRGLTSPRGVAVSADGAAVYVVLEDSDGIAVFVRDPVTGLLTQPPGAAGCANRTGSDGCAVAVGMANGIGVAVSGDGKSVYASGQNNDAVAVFDRVECPPATTTTSTTTTTDTSTTTTSTTTTTTLEPPTTTTSSTTTTTIEAGAEACGEAPLAFCRDQAGLARLRMRNVGTAVSPTVEFVWKLGEMTAVEALGDPIAGPTSYSLCVFAGGARVLDLTVPPGPRWRAGTKRRFRYYDGNGAADGVRRLVLQAGATGEAKVRVRARGANLTMPALPLETPLLVQFVGDDGGGLECWEAAFPSVLLNTETKVEAVQ